MSYDCGGGKQGHSMCEIVWTTMCPMTVVGVSKVILSVKCFCCNKVSFFCQLNFMEIIRLSQSWGESGHPQFLGFYQI